MSLQRSADQLETLNCRVVVVTFGSEELARRWREETGCVFPVVSDVSRSIYRYFSFPSSVRYTWDIKAQTWYAEQKCLGRKLHPMMENDDPHQLGGNVILDKEGVMRMIYRSKYPIDRPSVNDMLIVVRHF